MTSTHSRRNSRRSGRSKKKQTSPVLWIVLILVLVALVAAGAFFLFGDKFAPEEKEYYDPAAVAGTYHANGYTDPISTGALYPLVLESITADSTGLATIGFENVAANPYELQLTLLLEGEAIYTSGVITPGSYIETATLDEVPAAGSYTVVARFIAYDAETQKAVGKVDYPVPVTVTVG